MNQITETCQMAADVINEQHDTRRKCYLIIDGNNARNLTPTGYSNNDFFSAKLKFEHAYNPYTATTASCIAHGFQCSKLPGQPLINQFAGSKGKAPQQTKEKPFNMNATRRLLSATQAKIVQLKDGSDICVELHFENTMRAQNFARHKAHNAPNKENIVYMGKHRAPVAFEKLGIGTHGFLSPKPMLDALCFEQRFPAMLNALSVTRAYSLRVESQAHGLNLEFIFKNPKEAEGFALTIGKGKTDGNSVFVRGDRFQNHFESMGYIFERGLDDLLVEYTSFTSLMTPKTNHATGAIRLLRR